jgi:hypothetical protein
MGLRQADIDDLDGGGMGGGGGFPGGMDPQDLFRMFGGGGGGGGALRRDRHFPADRSTYDRETRMLKRGI